MSHELSPLLHGEGCACSVLPQCAPATLGGGWAVGWTSRCQGQPGCSCGWRGGQRDTLSSGSRCGGPGRGQSKEDKVFTPQPLPAKPPMVPQPHSLLWSCGSCWGKGPSLSTCPAQPSALALSPSHCPSEVSSAALTIQPPREIPVGLAVRKVWGKGKLGFLVFDATRTWPFPGRPTGVSFACPS